MLFGGLYAGLQGRGEIFTHSSWNFFRCEHYDPFHIFVFLLQVCEAAVEAGVDCCVLCDTNGGSLPWEVSNKNRLRCLLMHCPYCDV